MAARDDERAAVLLREIGEHPQGRQMAHRVRIGRADVAGILLIERPVRVPLGALVPRVVDDAGVERDAQIGPEQRLGQPEQAGLGK